MMRRRGPVEAPKHLNALRIATVTALGGGAVAILAACTPHSNNNQAQSDEAGYSGSQYGYNQSINEGTGYYSADPTACTLTEDTGRNSRGFDTGIHTIDMSIYNPAEQPLKATINFGGQIVSIVLAADPFTSSLEDGTVNYRFVQPTDGRQFITGTVTYADAPKTIYAQCGTQVEVQATPTGFTTLTNGKPAKSIVTPGVVIPPAYATPSPTPAASTSR